MKVADLFAGVGGLSLGFEQAGFDVAFAVEFDKDIAEAYEKNRVFFRMRKRHLLPALHDGMQGDEDGMQTCERPPLWAFGWPRGGVHMFTSLHVACLARVA